MTTSSKRSKRPANKRKFTELFVRKLKTSTAALVVWDTLQRGLAIRVRPSGAKAWKCIYGRHGRTRWLHLGDANAIGLSDAQQLAAECMLAVARGGDPAAEKRAERGAGTFAELATKYVEQWAKKHNKSWRQGEALVSRYATSRWSKLLASTITRSDVKTLLAGIERPVLANQVLASVSAVFTWAAKEELVPANPCRGVDRNPTKSRERVLSDSELPKFWAALNGIDPVIGAALKTIALTGQRPGEVNRMRYEHLRDGWWIMPGEPVPSVGWPGTKNAASHRVWLPQPVQALIGEGTSGFVFAGARGRPVRGLDEAMRSISAKLGEPVRPHDLRRSHGTQITAMGFGRDIMNRIQNHAEGGISSVYDRHQYGPEIQHTMEAVASRIIALAEKRATGNVVAFER